MLMFKVLMVFVESPDTIYFSGLGDDITDQEVAERFGSIGRIKIDKKTNSHKITLYRDKDTQAPKGDGTITYEDPEACKAAIEWFDGTTCCVTCSWDQERILRVEL